MGHARALLALEEGEREDVAARIERDGLTVRDLERLAKRPKAKGHRRQHAVSADLAAVEQRLRLAVGAPVAVIPKKRGGKLEIRYADTADLTRIVDALLD